MWQAQQRMHALNHVRTFVKHAVEKTRKDNDDVKCQTRTRTVLNVPELLYLL